MFSSNGNGQEFILNTLNKLKNKIMKNLFLLLIVSITLSGCRGCFADYEQKRMGVRKVCPGCTYTRSEGMDMAVDTTTQPNTVYRVYFCNGGFYYNAWDVDHLTKVQ